MPGASRNAEARASVGSRPNSGLSTARTRIPEAEVRQPRTLDFSRYSSGKPKNIMETVHCRHVGLVGRDLVEVSEREFNRFEERSKIVRVQSIFPNSAP